MFGQRHRRWTNIKAALGQRVMLARIRMYLPKKLQNICTMTAQRLPWSNIVKMFCVYWVVLITRSRVCLCSKYPLLLQIEMVCVFSTMACRRLMFLL